ncbi:MAG: hypothetical protein H0X37_08400 [Herpetosiphonaceae bacterium]|nr:hypothetical protein [Herpetosiphonaceae bacterium]
MGTTQRGLLKGPKFNGKHTTLIAAAERIVVALRDDPRVTKIIIGMITSRRGRTTTLKAVPINAGLRITITSPQNVQELYVYTGDVQGVQTTLEELRVS